MHAIKLFFCSARKDQALQSQLLQHMSSLVQSGQVIPWDDSEILPGANWRQEVENHLQTADIILLLVSANFLSSVYCSDELMQIVLRRHETKEAHIIPVILRPTYWKETPFGILHALPVDGKPVVEWHNRDQAFQNVVKSLVRVVAALYEAKATSPIRLPRHLAHPRPLTPSEIENALQRLPGWKTDLPFISGEEPRRGMELVKIYEFANYDVALGFINKASEHVAVVQHHPTWEITWGTVKARLTTWGIEYHLSRYDLDLATYFDNLASEYPPPTGKK